MVACQIMQSSHSRTASWTESAMMDEQAPDQAPSSSAVWNLLDRRDPAWKALYSLYNPDNLQGRAAGLQYSLQNRQAIQKRVAARASATAAAAEAERVAEQQRKPSPKKKVAVPHFKQQAQEVPDPLAAVPRRRPGQVIREAMQAEVQQAWGQVPLPSGRLIDEQEKQRCALLMQFKGNIPSASQLTPAGQAKVAAAAARSSAGSTHSSMTPADAASSRLAKQRCALQQRFEEAEQELVEREDFVASMQQLGRLQQDQLGAMRAEAAAKVKEMRQLDEQIKGLDRQLRDIYSLE